MKTLFLGLLLLPIPAFASEMVIHFNAPTAREDGAAMDNGEIAKYYVQSKIPNEADFMTIGEVLSVAGQIQYEYHYPLADLSGEYCFGLQTEDVNGLKSAWTDPVCATYIPITNPKYPVIINIEIRATQN